MKYDCSKIVDYNHEWIRMCDTVFNEGCDNCPIKDVGENCYHIRFITQEYIDIVQKWSDEHPEKTRQEAYLEIFPKLEALRDKVICFDDHFPCFGDLIGIGGCEEEKTCSECWNEPYAGEFEKAREEK